MEAPKRILIITIIFILLACKQHIAGEIVNIRCIVARDFVNKKSTKVSFDEEVRAFQIFTDGDFKCLNL